MALDIRNSWGSSSTSTVEEGLHQPFVTTIACLEDNVFEERRDGEVLIAYMPGFGFGMDSGKPYLAPLNVFRAGAETPWSEWVQGGLLILFRTVVAGQAVVHLLTAKVGDRFQDGIGWNISAGTLSPLEGVMVNAAQHAVRTMLGSKRHPKGAADQADAKALAQHLSNGVWPVQYRAGLKTAGTSRNARQGGTMSREAVASAFEVEDLDAQV